MGSNHGIMVMTMNSWILTIISWVGFWKKVGFGGSKLSPKLKNIYRHMSLKSELPNSSLVLSYSRFSDFDYFTDHEFMDSNHDIGVITMN